MHVFEAYPAVQSFLEYLKFEKRYSKHTLIAYENDLMQFFSFLIAEFDSPQINAIPSTFIRTWLASLKGEELTAKSINRKISSLKSFFKYQMKNGIITQTPMATIVIPKMSKRLPSFVEEKDIHTLMSYVEFGDDWKGRTEKLVMQLFYSTGMRLSELINLKESQLDESYAQIKVIGKGNKERIIPVNKDLIGALKNYIQEKPCRLENVLNLFINENGKPLQPRAVYSFVKKYLSQN